MKSRKVKSIFKVMIFGKLKRNPRKQKRPAGRGEEGITDKIGMTFGFDVAASILDASEAVMNTVLHQPRSACWRRSGAPAGQNLMWIVFRHYTLRFI